MADATLEVAIRPEADAANGMANNASAPATAAHIDYLLHLADNALVLGQRNAEWCGHGPVLEEDIAMANISVDLIGQARMLYQHIAELKADGATEDTLAYFRNAPDFRNFNLLELPHSIAGSDGAGGARDYAVTIVRNFLYSALMLLRWEALRRSTDAQLAAIAERSVKETRYHLRHSRDWLVRLGDGTPESHAKTQAAWDHLIPYSFEFWTDFAIEEAASKQGIGVAAASLRDDWQLVVNDAAREATLASPVAVRAPDGAQAKPIALLQGKRGDHSPHLAPLLADMQILARQHPGATW
jgi:ring-1,2-phenylacetyl-CoA epoxidase subunit PaaC